MCRRLPSNPRPGFQYTDSYSMLEETETTQSERCKGKAVAHSTLHGLGVLSKLSFVALHRMLVRRRPAHMANATLEGVQRIWLMLHR